MVKPKPKSAAVVLATATVAGLAALVWWDLTPAPAPGAAASSASERGLMSPTTLPRIDLARLDAKHPKGVAGDTDVFQFGAPSTKIVASATPPPVAPQPAPVEVTAAQASVPTMNVKYIGAVADKKGLKVAVLMTDRKEVLTGRPGDIVANRLRIVSIGLESVDVQDVGSDHVRRIPLR